MRSASPRNQRGRDRHLGGSIASEIRWGFGKVPTIQNVEILRVADQFASPATAALLQNFSNPTILEGKTRPWLSVLDETVALLPLWPSLSTFETMARVFDTNVVHSYDSHRHWFNCGNIGGVFSQLQSLTAWWTSWCQ